MKEDSCQALLGAIYELEGLVRMLKGRKHDASVLIPMIKQKGSQIARITAGMQSHPEVPDVPAVEGKKGGEVPPVIVAGKTEKVPEVAEKIAQAPAVVPAAPPVVPAGEVKQAPPVVKAPEKVSPAPEIMPGVPPAANSGHGTRTPLRSLFPLNETFRFPRTLFSGSKEDFYASLDVVAQMKSYDQACAYFYGDLQWNAEDMEVREFMAIISRYFTNTPY